MSFSDRCAQGELRSFQSLKLDIAGMHRAMLPLPVKYYVSPAFLRQTQLPAVLAIQDCTATGRQSCNQLSLSLGDRLLGAQPLQVSQPDVCDDTDQRLANSAQSSDLSLSAHRHLQDNGAIITIQAQQGQGKTDLIVLIPLGF